VPLLEKASAKFFGTYENLNGGWGDIAFQQMTGYPVKWFRHTIGREKMLEAIKTADDAHHVMWLEPMKKTMGLYSGHQYSLLSHINWDGKDFVQVRNPWGKGEYNGPWSDYDKKTDATKLAAFRAHVKQLKKHE